MYQFLSTSLLPSLTFDLISFEELGANPEKAKKPHNRPKDATEFAEKFYHGFYSLVEDEDIAEAKSHK
jgi:hypothetical protein